MKASKQIKRWWKKVDGPFSLREWARGNRHDERCRAWLSNKGLAVVVYVLAASGCATTKNIISVAQCGVADDRLGKVVTDPVAVREYFRRMIAEGREIVTASTDDPGVAIKAAQMWIADMRDLIKRMLACVPRDLARDAELVLARVRSIRGPV